MQSSCDLQVDVNGEHIFYVQKGILATYSGRLALFVDKLPKDLKKIRVIFHDFPGGADVFELILKYCYNEGKINITPSNFLLLNCAAKFMEMNDQFPGHSGLINETNQYWKKVDCFTWDELVDCLKQCQKLFPGLDHSEMLQKILEDVADRASLVCLPSRVSLSSLDSSCADFSGDTSSDSMRSNAIHASWWFKDLQFLRLELLEKVVRVMISRELDHALISSFLFYYQKNRFLKASLTEKWKIMETVINLLDLLDGNSVPVKRLLYILQVSHGLKQKPCCIHKLECMIGRVLDDASVCDLLVPSQSKSYTYDVNVVLRFLKQFVISNAKQFDINRLNKVASLIDLYILEVAPDPGLKHLKFLSLVTSLPDLARHSHDKLYAAIDVYLKVHTNLHPDNKIKLCGAVNCEKLSAGCLFHLAQNHKFPAYAGDNSLVSLQERVKNLGVPVGNIKKGSEDDDKDPQRDKSSRKIKYRGVEGLMWKVLQKLHPRTSKMHHPEPEPRTSSLIKGRLISAMCR